ncbi:MAG: SMI1/KNR4 family protein [Roseivirga sp.]|nr:SMI1/KNR4 family protein [Roseivirga sp.]
MSSTDLIDLYIATYKSKLADLEDFMNPPARAAEIIKLEEMTGNSLPESYKELLSRYNGEKKYFGILNYGFMSLTEVERQYLFMKDDQDVGGYQPKLEQPGRAFATLVGKNRLPFAHDGTGNYFCFDFEPDVNGVKGQVVYIAFGDSDPLIVLANSFEDFLTFLMESVKNGQTKFHDDREDYDFRGSIENLPNHVEVWFETLFRLSDMAKALVK